MDLDRHDRPENLEVSQREAGRRGDRYWVPPIDLESREIMAARLRHHRQPAVYPKPQPRAMDPAQAQTIAAMMR